MALYWTIDSRLQLVVVTAEGGVTRADVDKYIDAMEGVGAIGYRKIYDGRAGVAAMDDVDMLAISARFRSYHGQPVGALALVLPEDKSEPVARMVGILASAERPIRLFASLPAAKRWIDGQASSASDEAT